MTIQQLRDEFELLSWPGHTILEYMDFQEITITQLANKLFMLAEDLMHLILGKIPLTPEIATALARVTAIDTEFWLNSEALYRNKLDELIVKLHPTTP